MHHVLCCHSHEQHCKILRRRRARQTKCCLVWNCGVCVAVCCLPYFHCRCCVQHSERRVLSFACITLGSLVQGKMLAKGYIDQVPNLFATLLDQLQMGSSQLPRLNLVEALPIGEEATSVDMPRILLTARQERCIKALSVWSKDWNKSKDVRSSRDASGHCNNMHHRHFQHY